MHYLQAPNMVVCAVHDACISALKEMHAISALTAGPGHPISLAACPVAGHPGAHPCHLMVPALLQGGKCLHHVEH